ncbi:unnamed protein product [Rotaria sordida]|uniref:Uncharacterized protein n=1 Tax=Rotaria sordida TaxID=392033 RepID=A0A815E807_9BILA|nr:unnamed protein product [Rotaria sordida]CAF3946767.1 unnamed protein product [Rotaria sordida]
MSYHPQLNTNFDSDEYLDFLVSEIDQDNELCTCKKCEQNRQDKIWPYFDSLVQSLYYISTRRFFFNPINDEEFQKYKNGLILDYKNDKIAFDQYVEDVCLIGNEFGLLVLCDYKKGYYNKHSSNCFSVRNIYSSMNRYLMPLKDITNILC